MEYLTDCFPLLFNIWIVHDELITGNWFLNLVWKINTLLSSFQISNTRRLNHARKRLFILFIHIEAEKFRQTFFCTCWHKLNTFLSNFANEQCVVMLSALHHSRGQLTRNTILPFHLLSVLVFTVGFFKWSCILH